MKIKKRIDKRDFSATIYEQFTRAISHGVVSASCHIPVVSPSSNRITLGIASAELAKVSHTVTFKRHPTGFIRAMIESPFGLACPDPLPYCRVDNAGKLPANATEPAPGVKNHQAIYIVSAPTDYSLWASEFDGRYSKLTGLDQNMQNLFATQVATVALRNIPYDPTVWLDEVSPTNPLVR